jgi:hypothetical protein
MYGVFMNGELQLGAAPFHDGETSALEARKRWG